MKSPIAMRVVLVLSVAVVVAALLSVASVHDAIDRALAAVAPLFTTRPLLGGVLFVLLAALSAVLAFFSSALLVPGGVYAWGTWPTIALLWLGWLLGGMGTYALGRVLRRPLLPTRDAARTLAHYARRLPQNASWPLVLLLQLALPSEVPGYLCGFLRVRFRVYASALAVAELPYAIGAVLAGDSVVRGHGAGCWRWPCSPWRRCCSRCGCCACGWITARPGRTEDASMREPFMASPEQAGRDLTHAAARTIPGGLPR